MFGTTRCSADFAVRVDRYTVSGRTASSVPFGVAAVTERPCLRRASRGMGFSWRASFAPLSASHVGSDGGGGVDVADEHLGGGRAVYRRRADGCAWFARLASGSGLR